MNKFVVVGSPALAEQMGAAGHEAAAVPANASFGLLMGRISAMGDPAQVVLVCTPERLDLALTALPYVGLSVAVGVEPSNANDGVLRVPSQDAAAVLAATQQYGAPQPTPMPPQPPQPQPLPPHPPQPTPMPPQPPQPQPLPPHPPQPTPMPPQPPHTPTQPTPITPQPTQPPPMPTQPPHTQPQPTPITPQPPGNHQGEGPEGAMALPASGHIGYTPPALPDFFHGEPSAPSPSDRQAHTAEPVPIEVPPSPRPDSPTIQQAPPQQQAPLQQAPPRPDSPTIHQAPPQQAPPQPDSPTIQQAPPQQTPPAMGKAQFDETTYDPAFKGAPWANQVTDPAGPHGLVVGITAAKGGAGKSTLTCWLSEALTAKGTSVALIDANIGQPDIAKMTRTWGRASGIAALAGERRFSDEEMFEASCNVDGLGLVLGGPANPMEEMPEPMLAAMALATERLAAHYEFVIVDTPVGTVYEPVFGRFVLHVADILLVVTNPHQPTVHDTVLWVDSMSKPPEEGGFGWPGDRTIGVLNRSNPDTDLPLELVRTWAPNLDIIGDVPEVPGVIAAVNNGEWRCPEPAQNAVAGIADQLCAAHPSITDPLAMINPTTAEPPPTAKSKKKAKGLGLMKRLRGR